MLGYVANGISVDIFTMAPPCTPSERCTHTHTHTHTGCGPENADVLILMPIANTLKWNSSCRNNEDYI